MHQGQKGRKETHSSGNGGSLEGIIPTKHARGRGTWLLGFESDGSPVAKRELRGVGHTCSLAMGDEKINRVRKLVPK